MKLSAVEREEESGSDMEGVADGVGRLSPWVYFRNLQEELISIHRVVLQHKKVKVMFKNVKVISNIKYHPQLPYHFMRCALNQHRVSHI